MIVKAICTTGLRIDVMIVRTSLTDSTTGEELDTTQVDSDSASGGLALIDQVQEEAPNLILGQ
jgi:hypothetical protein